MYKQVFFTILILTVMIPAGEQFSEEYHYVVNYFMMPSLDMKISLTYDYEFEGKKTGKINVTTETKNFFDKIFKIDNQYFTVFELSDKSCLYHQKKISQPNVTQNLQINYGEKMATYSNGETRTFKTTQIYDFFSMLVYLRTVDCRRLETQKIVIDMEGEFFRVNFIVEGTEGLSVGGENIQTRKIKLVYHKIDPKQPSVLDYTDIFFWKIAGESGEKYIWVEADKKKRIIKARFSEGRGALEAKLVEAR
ncbi:MAG: DUF3108 domain-containing protein [Fidelibacterota bacterium]